MSAGPAAAAGARAVRTLGAVLAVAGSVAVVRAAELVLVDAGQARAALVLPAQPAQDERLAAEELRLHLLRMSGVELPVTSAQAPAGLTAVRIGLPMAAAAQARIQQLSQDPAAFLLSVRPDGALLAGLTPEGSLFAAYELLEQLGCRWYMPGDLGTVVPNRGRVGVALQETIRFPSFPHRHLQAVPQDLAWYRRQRLGGAYFPSSHGIPLLPPADVRAEPELFALVDGQRTGSQLCLSNPEVLRRAVAATLAYFEEHPDQPWIGMGPSDGSGFCQCPGCRALDGDDWDPWAAELSMTDRYVWFFNQVLAGIESRYPDRRLAFYAYHSYQLPPRRCIPDRRIVPALAPIDLCRIHGMSNPGCPDRSLYLSLMQGWGRLVPELFERGYYFNLADPCLPFSKVHAIRDETVQARRAGVTGWRVECMPGWAVHTPTLYVAARLMWQVDTDVDSLLQEFYHGFFGPAAAPMGEYLEGIDHAFRDADCHTGGGACARRIFTPERIDRAGQLFDRAGGLADGVYAERVRVFRMGFERLRLFAAMLDARDAFDFATARACLQELRDLTERMLACELEKGAPLLWPGASRSYLERFWSAAVEQGWERTVASGDLVAGAPETWHFLIDPAGVGERLGWWRDGAIGGNWQRLHTTAASWGDQGLHYYKGLAWYRTQLEVPADFAGRRVLAFFGGVDEQARVWLNGQLLGESAAGSFTPFELDATAAVRPGGTNTLAVCVTNRTLDELGTGGLTAPVMLWSPRAAVR